MAAPLLPGRFFEHFSDDELECIRAAPKRRHVDLLIAEVKRLRCIASRAEQLLVSRDSTYRLQLERLLLNELRTRIATWPPEPIAAKGSPDPWPPVKMDRDQKRKAREERG